MNILCLCPTYGRPPQFVANAIALFQAQDYPVDQCKLLVLDDAGQFEPQNGVNWSIVPVPERYESMPKKYQAMWELERLHQYGCQWDAIAKWDDDDIYLPNHLRNHSQSLTYRGWSHPARAYCLYDPIKVEDIGGNMWSSLAVTTKLLRSIKWQEWFDYKGDDFDFQFLHILGQTGAAGRHPEISFMFRWNTGVPHLQWFCGKGTAYKNYPKHDTRHVNKVVPTFDPETEMILGKYMRKELPQ